MIAFNYYHDRASALTYLDKQISRSNNGSGVPGGAGWLGWGVDRLELCGTATKREVRELLKNRHPLDARRLISAGDMNAARKSPRLTEIIIASPPLPAGRGDTGILLLRHRIAAQIAASHLEELACGRSGDYGMRILTANVVGLSFERYRFRRGLKRLFTHFVLFNFTFDKSGPAWRGLDSSEMESAVPNVVKRCWSEMHHYSITPAMLEKARQMETAERRVAGVRQTFRGLN